MPFEVFGFVEVAYGAPEDGESFWFPAIALDAFTLGGDAVSDLLFGLAKKPSGRGLCVGRGIPADSSALVAREFEANRQFIAAHGDGSFGHSYATFREIGEIRWDTHGIDPTGSEWWTVFALVNVLRERLGFTDDRMRVVAWATW